MLEKFGFKKSKNESLLDIDSKSESFKTFNEYVKKDLNAKEVQSDENSIKYITDINIKAAKWFENLATEYSDIDVTSEESETDPGIYYITITSKQLATHE